MRNLIDLISKLKHAHHRIRLTLAAKADLAWWDKGLDLFHGTTGFNCDVPLPSYEFSTDVCLVGGGAHFQDQWFYVNWHTDMPEISDSHINILELEVIHIAAELWGEHWRGKHILVRSDNSATVSAINKGSVRNPAMLAIIQQMFWLSVKFEFRLSAAFLPGRLNILSDNISRLHSIDSSINLGSFLGSDIECNGHMSQNMFMFLQNQWMSE